MKYKISHEKNYLELELQTYFYAGCDILWSAGRGVFSCFIFWDYGTSLHSGVWRLESGEEILSVCPLYLLYTLWIFDSNKEQEKVTTTEECVVAAVAVAGVAANWQLAEVRVRSSWRWVNSPQPPQQRWWCNNTDTTLNIRNNFMVSCSSCLIILYVFTDRRNG